MNEKLRRLAQLEANVPPLETSGVLRTYWQGDVDELRSSLEAHGIDPKVVILDDGRIVIDGDEAQYVGTLSALIETRK